MSAPPKPLIAPQLGRLPLGVQPTEDESLESYLDRLAHRYSATRGQMLRATGLSPTTGPARYPLAYPVAFAEGLMTAFCARTGLAAAQVQRMQLIHYDNTALTVRAPDGTVRPPRELGLHEWVYVYGANACPQCLTERGGAARLAWKLPWSFACARHRLVLIHQCPVCDAPLVPERNGKSSPFTSHLLTPGSCAARARDGRTRQPCGCPLSDAHAAPADKRLLAAQATYDAAIAGHALPVLGRLTRAHGYLRHARALTGLALRFAMPDDAGPLPTAVRSALEAFVDWRTRTLHEKGEGRAAGPRLRTFTATPRNPAVMAALAPAVCDALASADAAAAGERLDWLVARMRDAGLPPAVGSRYGLTPELSAALALRARPGVALWSTALDSPSSSDARSSAGSARPRRFGRVGAQHLPQVLWREAYEPLYRELLPTRQQLAVRTFLSLLAAKTVLQGTWAQAAEGLGMDYIDARQRANGYTTRSTRNRLSTDLRRRTHLLLGLLADSRQLVDYVQRRRQFAHVSIEDDSWQALAAAAGIHPGYGTRQRNAAVWVWSELTGGPYYRAPAAEGAFHQPSGRVLNRQAKDAYFWAVFNRFYRDELPQLRPHLETYAHGLLDGEPLRPLNREQVETALARDGPRLAAA